MNLIELIRGVMIEGVPTEDLKKAINHDHPTLKVRSSANGTIVLSNRKIVKCVNEYYENPDKAPDRISGVNICHTVHRNLDISGIRANHCGDCHLHCMAKQKEGSLKLKTKKSSTKRRR